MNNERQRNKLFTMLLLVIALLIPQWGWAQVATQPKEGDGTQEKPYLIATAEELEWFRDYVNDGNLTACAKLTKDIDMSSVCYPASGDVEEKSWAPIGSTSYWEGAFDGDNHTISNLYINSKERYTGLFGKVGQSQAVTIRNVKFNNAIVESSNYNTAILVGYVYKGEISGITVQSGSVSSTSDRVSGIVGTADYDVKIIECENHANITGNSYVGGIFGRFFNAPVGDGYIQKCSNFANISSTEKYAGGIGGSLNGGTITDCANYGDIKGTYIGGIVGFVSQDCGSTCLKNSFTCGNIEGTNDKSGLVVGVDPQNVGTLEGVVTYCSDAIIKVNNQTIESKAIGMGQFGNADNGIIEGYSLEELYGGKATWMLNGSKSEGSLAWYQKLGENGDAYPVLKSTGDNTVYGAYHHGEKDVFFSNAVITNQHSVAYNAEAEDEASGNHDVNYEAGNYVWTEAEDKTQTPTVAVTYTCKICGKTETPQMTVEHDDAHENTVTCTEDGFYYYKATYAFNGKAVFCSDTYAQEQKALGHDMSAEVTFNYSKEIYQKGCTRNCGYCDYYATSDASVAAKANDDETTFVVDKFMVDDATVYDSKARFKVNELTYKRTFNHTGWQAVYVPFDIECGQISDDYELAYINNFHEYEMLDDTNIELEVMRITNNAVMPALTPCLIRKKQLSATESAKSETFHFADVWCKPAADRAIDCASVTRYYEFFGTLKGKDSFDSYNDFYMTSEGLVKANDGKSLDPQRWYLKATDRIGGLLYPTARLGRIAIRVIGDDEPTGIEGIYVKTDTGVANGSKQGIYDLQGRKLSQEPENGIYIKDGKKYVK